jgi:hypothetical protein
MKTFFIIIGVILLFPCIAIGSYIFDDFYYNQLSDKAEKAVILYLEKKYQERFGIEESAYSKALGDDKGSYVVYAFPIENPDITIRLGVSQNHKVSSDDYKDSKWRNDAIEDYKRLIHPFFPKPANMFVNPSIPSDIEDRFELEDTYDKMINHYQNQSDEFIHLMLIEDRQAFDKEKEWSKIKGLIELLKERPIKSFTLELKYFPRSLKEKYNTYSDPNEFENDHSKELYYICRIHSSEVQNILIDSNMDIEKFCRELF